MSPTPQSNSQAPQGNWLSDLGRALPQIAGATRGVTGLISAFNAPRTPSWESIFGGERQREATEELRQRASQQLRQIRNIFGDIGELTGIPTERGVEESRRRFEDYIDAAYLRGRRDVFQFDPSLGQTYDTLTNRIGDVTNQYSLLRNPEFMQSARNPETYTVDVGSITGALNLDPTQRASYMSYSDQPTQEMIRGDQNVVNRFAGRLANSGDINRLMRYTV